MAEDRHVRRPGALTRPDAFGESIVVDGSQVVRDDRGLIPTDQPREIAVLVGLEITGRPGLLSLEDSLNELEQLAHTAGLEVRGRLTQRLRHPNPATFIGPGKLEELKAAVAELGANVVVFDEELSPRQQRELEKALGDGIKVLDRTALILDIFARHAHTREGAVQVELAQYEYRLPRLTRAWTHLARQAGGRAGGATGGVGVRGPGETQLEVDRREIRRRIAHLRRELAEIRKHREQYRQRRRTAPTPVVAIVGYTNAGKSTLLNALSRADVLVEDQLFATLDPTTRRVALPHGQVALFTDTVGFIQKLPTTLVAAFRATLEEIAEADLLVHVVDISHPNADEQVAAVEEVLEELGVGHKPVVTGLNKVDRLDPQDEAVQRRLVQALQDYPHPVLVSARTGQGLDDLLAKVEEVLAAQMASLEVLIPYHRGDLAALFHEHGQVDAEEFTEEGTRIRGRVPSTLLGTLLPYAVPSSGPGQAEARCPEGGARAPGKVS